MEGLRGMAGIYHLGFRNMPRKGLNVTRVWVWGEGRDKERGKQQQPLFPLSSPMAACPGCGGAACPDQPSRRAPANKRALCSVFRQGGGSTSSGWPGCTRLPEHPPLPAPQPSGLPQRCCLVWQPPAGITAPPLNS